MNSRDLLVNDKTLSVVIPCYNEETRGNLRNRLNQVYNYLETSSYEFEMILINDGSADNTLSILNEYDNHANVIIINNKQNKGKGKSLIDGFKVSSKKYILMMDADLSVDLNYIEEFMLNIKENTCIIASRYCKDAKIIIKQNTARQILSLLAHKCISLYYKLNIKDTQCGFKIFPREVILQYVNFFTAYTWLLDLEILYFLNKKGYRIIEKPVKWGTELNSTMTNLRKTLFNCIIELFKIKKDYRRYKKYYELNKK